MNARRTAAGLLAAVALAATAGSAHAAPILPDQLGPGAVREVAPDSLLHHLRLQYAEGQQRYLHNELVLILNVPTSAVL